MAPLDVATPVTDGHDVPALTEFAVPGKVTLIDLYAPWCESCRELDAHILELLAHRPNLAYRKLDIVDWESPLARHHLAKVPSLPYVIVVDRSGARVVDAISGLQLARLDAAIEVASR